jgi:hypothetical protein
MTITDEAGLSRDEMAVRLSPHDAALTRILRAAFAVLDLESGLDPAVAGGVKALPDLVAASRRVIDELGFGDPPRDEESWGGTPGRVAARKAAPAQEQSAR